MDDECRVYLTVVLISVSKTEASLALCECMTANVVWSLVPDVKQMRFTNITPGMHRFPH